MENTNAVCFQLNNDTDTEKRYYLQEMNIQSFLRNIDWTTNCFSWIEARVLTTPTMYFAVDSDDTDKSSTEFVYVLCTLRIRPGTYSNVESVIDEINKRLKANVELPESQNGGAKTVVRDLPCALYGISPEYDTVADYKITGFRVSMLPDGQNYTFTTRGYYPSTKIAPAVLSMELFPIDTHGTNNSTVINVSQPRPPPVVHYDLKTTYTLNYPGAEKNIIAYNACVSALNDDVNALNHHSIDFSAGITNHLGLTPFQLPIDHLFSINGEPVICYNNGSDYIEYLINPNALDTKELSTYFVNTVASNETVTSRGTQDSIAWSIPAVKDSSKNDNETLFKLSDFGLNSTSDLHDLDERVIINDSLCPKYLLLREAQTVGDFSDIQYKDNIDGLLKHIYGNEVKIERNEEVDETIIEYIAEASNADIGLRLIIWFAGGTEYIRHEIHARLIEINVETLEEKDITEFLTGFRIVGSYSPVHMLNTINELPGDGSFNVINRLDATYTIPVLAAYTSKKWLENNSVIDVSLDSNMINAHDTNITSYSMANSVMPLENVEDSEYRLIVDNTNIDDDVVKNTSIDYAIEFTPAVYFTVPLDKKAQGNDTLPLVNKSLAQLGSITRKHSTNHRFNWLRTGKITTIIAPHDHEYKVEFVQLDLTFRHSLEIEPTDKMIAIYDHTKTAGYRVYRAIDVKLYEYKYVVPEFQFYIKFTGNDYCSGAHTYTKTVNGKWTAGGGSNEYYVDDGGWWGAHGGGCSHTLCKKNTRIYSHTRDNIPIIKKEHTNARESLCGKGIIYTYTVYVPYVENEDGKYRYDGTSADTKIKIPYTEYNELYGDMVDKLTQYLKNNTNAKNFVNDSLPNIFERIYPLGPYTTNLPEGTTVTNNTEDMNSDDKTDIHTLTWFGGKNGYAIFDNDNSTKTSKSLSSMRNGQGLSSEMPIPLITKSTNMLPITNLSEYGLTLVTDNSENVYKVSLLRSNNAKADISFLPISDLFEKSCSCGKSVFILHTLQAFAYASIPSYNPETDERALLERSSFSRDPDDLTLDIGSEIVNGKVYLMDRNNLFATTVNSVKYYPFFGFSSKLYVYMMSNENVDDVIESQLPHLRTIRASLADIDIPTKYTTTTAISTSSTIVRFTNASSVPITSTGGVDTAGSGINLTIAGNGMTLSPVDAYGNNYGEINKLAINLNSPDINIPVTVTGRGKETPGVESEENPTTRETVTEGTQDNEESTTVPNTDTIPIMSGTVSLTGLTLSKLDGKSTTTITNTENIKGNVNLGTQLTVDDITSAMGNTLQNSTITGSITGSGSITGNVVTDSEGSSTTGVINDGVLSFDNAIIHGVLANTRSATTSMSRDVSGGNMEIYLNNSVINSLITATEFEPLTDISTLPDSTDPGDENTPVKEYGRGSIEIKTLNMDVNGIVSSGAINGITGQFIPQYYRNATPVQVTGTQYIPTSIDFSGIIGVMEAADGGESTTTETHRLNYEVEIKPYNIPINKTIIVPGNSSKYIYITGNIHRYPIWESTHTLTYKVV
jgi:hypothetical protein